MRVCYSWVLILFIFISCQENIMKDSFEGSWNVLNIYINGYDILQDENSIIFITSELHIDKNHFLLINNTEKEEITGEIYLNKDDSKELIIKDSENVLLNDKYKWEIDVLKSGDFETSKMKLESGRVIILAEKYNKTIRL